MTDMVTTTGVVATELRTMTTNEGLRIVNFRLAANQNRYNRATQKWEQSDTNWFTVSAFRQLATNLTGSIHQGDRVVVTGRLRIRNWENGARTGTVVEIDAESIGHDLNWGTSAFTLHSRNAGVAAEEREQGAVSAQPDPERGAHSQPQHEPQPAGLPRAADAGRLPVPAASTDANGWALPNPANAA